MRYLFLPVCLLACSSPVPANAPQFVAGPLAIGIDTTQATISWASDVPAEGVIVMTPTQGAPVSLVVPESQTHDALVTGLTPDTTYSTKITISAAGLSAESTISVKTLAGNQPGNFRILFDAAHGEDSGNADWVIDDGNRFASPANPSADTDWDGAISSWAFDLFSTGRYQIESLPDNATLTFNSAANQQDLSLFDALVLPEPNQPLSAGERTAVINFVQAGGGLVLVSDHIGADRDGDGFDAVEVLNQLME